MTGRRFGCGVAVAVPLVLIALAAVVTYVPPVHAIHAEGARGVTAHPGGSVRPFSGRVPAPTTSLTDLRCIVWYELRRESCHDSSAAPERLWPNLDQTPNTLYVPSLSDNAWPPGDGPSGFNVEYQPSIRKLTIHQYVTEPLIVWRHPESTGAGLAPGLDLLVVSTNGISSGVVTVEVDSWIERLTGDEPSGNGTLGTAEVS